MTCDELRERIVDPASSSQGGHAPVVAHLEECAACRSAARDFAALDRLIRPSAPQDPPADFEARLRQRLSAGPRSVKPSAWLLAAAVGVLLVGAILFLRARERSAEPRTVSPAATGAALPVERPRAAAASEEPPPAIVAVGSTPISFQSAPLSAEEKAEAVALHDFDFLNSFPTLAHLDSFFPEPVGPRAPIAVPPGGFPSRPPDSPDALTGRFLDWQRLPKKERARFSALEESFRNRPEDERALLEERWMLVKDFSDDQRAGLRRLASRIEELDAKAHDRLQAEIRLISQMPRDQRTARWRSLPFARPLTGQELASAERLLLSR